MYREEHSLEDLSWADPNRCASLSRQGAWGLVVQRMAWLHSQHCARVALALFAFVQGVATVAIDFNHTHASNPTWTGHARFHLVWQDLNLFLLALIEVGLAMLNGPYAEARFYLALGLASIPSAGFLLAQVAEPLYGGRLWDESGIHPLMLRIGGRQVEIDGNAAAVYTALAVLSCILWIFLTASR